MNHRTIYLGLLALSAVACGGTDPSEIGDGESTAEVEAAAPVDGAPFRGESDVIIEQGSLKDLEAMSAAMAVADARGELDVQKTCARPIGWHSDVVIGEMNMGGWTNQDNLCRDVGYCPDGTYAFSMALKSIASQGTDDDLAVTGVALGCNNPITGAFISWATPLPSADAPGSWDNSGVCSVGSPLWGGLLRLMTGPTSNSDDFGVTDGAGACSNGAAVNVTVNNPETWGTWQSWVTCPAGKRVCGVTNKMDPDNSSDDAGLTGIKVSCCDYS